MSFWAVIGRGACRSGAAVKPYSHACFLPSFVPHVEKGTLEKKDTLTVQSYCRAKMQATWDAIHAETTSMLFGHCQLCHCNRARVRCNGTKHTLSGSLQAI